jgi:hypothetical protein
MAMAADFAQLYSELGIRTDCSLEEFKRACRRRIRKQHPDRASTGADGDGAGIPLAELLPLYAKALRFHRKHGRLPGAAPAPAPIAMATRPVPPTGSTTPATTVAGEGDAGREADPSRPSLRGPLLAMLAIAAFLAAFGWWNDDAPADAQAIAAPVAEAAAPDDAPAVVERLEIGMDSRTVRRIQGEPLQAEGAQWIYGPSWLYFEDDHLVDWYSSPLYPLKTATSSPRVDETNLE